MPRSVLRLGALLPSALLVASCTAAAAQGLPSPPMAEHHAKPVSRTVVTTYRCADGERSVTVSYDRTSRGRVSKLVRNGRSAEPAVLDKLDTLLERLDSVSHVYPECGSRTDLLIVDGTRNRERSGLVIHWTDTDVTLAATL